MYNALVPGTGKEARNGLCPWLTGNLRVNELTKTAYSWSIGGRMADSFLQKCPLVEMGPRIGQRGPSQEGSTAFGFALPDSENASSDIVAFSKGWDSKKFEDIVAVADIEVLEKSNVLSTASYSQKRLSVQICSKLSMRQPRSIRSLSARWATRPWKRYAIGGASKSGCHLSVDICVI